MGGEIDDRLVPGNRLAQGRLFEQVSRSGTGPGFSERVRLRCRARHAGDVVPELQQLRDGAAADHPGRAADEDLHGRCSMFTTSASPAAERGWAGYQRYANISPAPSSLGGLGDNWSNNPTEDEAAQNGKAAARQRVYGGSP